MLDRYSALRDFDYESTAELGESFLEKARQLRRGQIIPGEAGTETLTRKFSDSVQSLPEVDL